MFARKVAARLKSKTLPEFINIIERDILPWLRKLEGFVDLIVLAMHGSNEVATVSFWQHETDAEGGAESGFPEATELLEKILDGPSYVKTFDVVSSTVHELAQLRKLEQNVLEENSNNSFPAECETPHQDLTL
jgi:heme-degrading monooxygenase HmoA